MKGSEKGREGETEGSDLLVAKDREGVVFGIVELVQGYLAHKKQRLPRTLQ